MEDYLTLHINKNDNGCNFCSAEGDEDLNDDLVVKDLKSPNGTFLIGAHVYITNEKNLEFYFDDSYGRPVDEPRRVQIHYCPMCGKKLEYDDRIKITNKEFSYDDPEFLMSLDLSVRSRNCLSRAGILSINDFCTLTAESLAEVRNLGRHSYIEIAYALGEHGVIISDILKTAAMYKSSMKTIV